MLLRYRLATNILSPLSASHLRLPSVSFGQQSAELRRPVKRGSLSPIPPFSFIFASYFPVSYLYNIHSIRMVYGMPQDVFISYSSIDKAAADTVCSVLEQNGISCWMAPRNITPGRNFAEAIIDGIRSSKVFVLVYSSNSNNSKQVIREVDRAVHIGLPVINLRLEDVPMSKELEYYLSSVHWLDAMTLPLEEHIQQLCDVVQMFLKPEEVKDVEIAEALRKGIIKRYGPDVISQRFSIAKRITIRISAILLFVVIAIVYIVLSNIGGAKQARAGSIESIVILPFANYTGVDTLDHFISGMHSALINEIGKIHGLRIISKVSSDTYKNSGKSIPEIAKELNVDAALELGVMCLGDTICFQPRLISGATEEKQLWIGDFQGAKGNLFNMFNQVIRQIAGEVKISLTPKEEAMLAESRILDREAVDAYLKSYDFVSDLSPVSLSKARDYLNNAIEKEPDWAELHAALGLVWFCMGATLIEPPEIAYPIVIEHNNKALKLDPDLAEAHYLIAFLAIQPEWNMEKAEKGFLKALANNPNYALARIHYSWLLYVLQRPEEAKMQAELAYSLDPLNPLMQNLYAVALELDGDCASAVSFFKKVLASNPDNLYAHRNIEVAAFQCGDYDVVMEAFKHILPIEEAAMNEMIQIYNKRGFKAALEEIMPHLEVAVEKFNIVPSKMAYRYYMINQDEKALEWLEKAAETGDGNVWMFGTKGFPFTRLYDNPGFIEILKRSNLPLPKT